MRLWQDSWCEGRSGQFAIRDTLISDSYESILGAFRVTAKTKVASAAPLIDPIGIDLGQLETFIAVARLGSFSLAAQELHLAQPSVTGRIQRLEAALGTRLLLRTTRKVETTQAGAALLLEASEALAGLRKLTAGFRQRAKLARQRVVVAATPMLAALSLPPIISAYSELFTDVQIVLRDLQYAQALTALETREADMAVLAFEGRDNRFRTQSLGSDEMVLAAPAKHPLAAFKRVTLAQIAPHPLLVIDPYRPFHQRMAEMLEERGMELAACSSVSNLNTLIGMLDAGMGAALLTRSIARRSARHGHVLIEFEDFMLKRTFSLVCLRNAHFGTAAESFSRFLRQEMAPRRRHAD